MGIRKEIRSAGSHVLTNGDYRARVTLSEHVDMPVTISYLRYLPGKRSRLGWHPSPENAVFVIVPEASSAPNLATGRELAAATLARLVSGSFVAEERPGEESLRPEVVREIDHPVKLLRALVLRWPDEFEVRMIGYLPNGYAMPVSSPSISNDPDNEWGRLDALERILADSEEEAVLAAHEELDLWAKSDLPIKDR